MRRIDEKMTGTEYTQLVMTTEKTPLLRLPTDVLLAQGLSFEGERAPHELMISRLQHALWGMSSETGELNDMLKKHLVYGKPFDRINAVEELGDQLWYIAIALDAIGIGFSTAMRANTEKLLVRYGGSFSSGKALFRDKVAERAALERVVLEDTAPGILSVGTSDPHDKRTEAEMWLRGIVRDNLMNWTSETSNENLRAKSFGAIKTLADWAWSDPPPDAEPHHGPAVVSAHSIDWEGAREAPP